MEELLRKILSEDRTLLNRKDDLIAILDEKVPGRLAREYNSIKRALNLNIGEIFATGNSDREAAIAKATEKLIQSGLQEARVKNVVDTFVKVLDWDKEPTDEEPFIEETEEIQPTDATETSAESINENPSVEDTTHEPPKNETPTPPPRVENPSYQQPPTQSQNQSPPTSSNGGLKIIIGILAIALFFAVSGNDDKNSSKETQSSYSHEEVSVEKAPPPEPYLDAKSDLSLNGVDLGTQLNQVENIFGQPNSIKNENNRTRYYYDDIEAVFNNDYLTAFVTYHSKYKTAKGLHVGSTYDEVISKYGTAPHIMQLDDLILYEYDYNTIRGEKSLLRFAVNKSDNRVNYISMRVLLPSDNNSGNKSNDVPENVQQAAGAFLSYHENITNRNFNKAYSLQTYSRQQNMGSINTFASGYSTTLKSEIVELNLVEDYGDTVVLSYVLEASDRINGGILYQKFKGEVEMVKEYGEWKINTARSTKIGERRG